jgi:hypothetical protein
MGKNGMAGERHGMCESAFSVLQLKTTPAAGLGVQSKENSAFVKVGEFTYQLRAQHVCRKRL